MSFETRLIEIKKENYKEVLELLESIGYKWFDEEKPTNITFGQRKCFEEGSYLVLKENKELYWHDGGELNFTKMDIEELREIADLEQRTIRCGGREYRIYCHKNMSGSTKFTGAFKISFGVDVYDVDDQVWLDWKELKNTYLLEKIESFLLNSANGRRSIY